MDELIYNQNEIPKEKWRYGLRTSAKTGCGWIAVYNALCILGSPMEPETLIHRFEKQLPIVHGNAGTFAAAPALMMRQLGYRVRVTALRYQFDALAGQSDVCILFYYWRRSWRVGAHFVTLRRTENGFEGYNTFANSHGPDYYGSSLDAFLTKQGYFGCLLTGIRKNGMKY